jgi:hypothetical protein
MPPAVDHVVVLALENRSFDHMLGFVPHADPAFDGLLVGGPYTNPPWRGGGHRYRRPRMRSRCCPSIRTIPMMR